MTQNKSDLENTNENGCILCKLMNHKIQSCFKFKKLPIDERHKFVKSAKGCFGCLKSGHFSKNCSEKCEKCGRRHHILLHDNARSNNNRTEQRNDANTISNLSAHAVSTSATSSESKMKMCLGIIPVKLVGNGVSINSYALIDSGSSATILRRDLYEKLGVKGEKRLFNVQTLNGKSQMNEQYHTKLTVSSVNGDNNVEVLSLIHI